MTALANFLYNNEGSVWSRRNGTLVNEALYRAAAVTPLTYRKSQATSSVHFDERELLQAALLKSAVDGTA